MSRSVLNSLVSVAACTVLFASAEALADTPPVISCPWYSPTVGDDFGSHGFYTAGYPGSSLKQVTLYLAFPGTGSYQLALVANAANFGGTHLGTANASLNVTSTDYQAVVFDFGTITVTEGTRITFHGNVISKPSGLTGPVLMEVTTDPVCRVYETLGSDAPLSSSARKGLAILITGDVPSSFGHVVVIPASASIHGANNTFFHTDVWIYNPLGVPLTGTLTYYCYLGQNCGSGPQTFTIGPGQSMTESDVVGTLFGAAETAGAIAINYSSPNTSSTLDAVTRTYSPSQPSPTNGAVMNGLPGINATGKRTFLGLGNNGGDRSAGFRTNVGAYNSYEYSTTITFTLTTRDGTPIGQPVTQTWAPHEARQINDIFGVAGAESTVTTDAVLLVTSTLPTFPYVTVIDNQSGDSIIEE